MKEESEFEWVTVAEVYNQEEAQLIVGLLEMSQIPVRIKQEAVGSIYGLTIGPLAQMQILVPSDRLEDARKILAANIENNETGEDN